MHSRWPPVIVEYPLGPRLISSDHILKLSHIQAGSRVEILLRLLPKTFMLVMNTFTQSENRNSVNLKMDAASAIWKSLKQVH